MNLVSAHQQKTNVNDVSSTLLVLFYIPL